jgi:hypothetical protein
MKYYSYNTYKTDPSVDPYVDVKSEEEILLEYWDYWYGKMCDKFGKDNVDQNYCRLDCIDDWCVVHWAWESK